MHQAEDSSLLSAFALHSDEELLSHSFLHKTYSLDWPEGWPGHESTLWFSQFGDIFVLLGVNSIIPLTVFSVVQDMGFFVDISVGLGP